MGLSRGYPKFALDLLSANQYQLARSLDSCDGWTRTSNILVNSKALYQLSYITSIAGVGIEPTPLAHCECATDTLNRHFSPTVPSNWLESIHQRCCSLGTASIRLPDVWTRQGSNLQPTPCKGVALPIELPAQSSTESPPPLSAIFQINLLGLPEYLICLAALIAATYAKE